MSKIGRKPIETQGIQLEIKGNEIHYKGSKASGVHTLPEGLTVEKTDGFVTISCPKKTSDLVRVWGLNRALLANKLHGAHKGFEQKVVITGLGYKGIAAGDKITFSLGYSHKIEFPLPDGVTVDIDKSGQNIVVKGTDKALVGKVSSEIRELRPPEPYKGTGIKLAQEVILRKAGKAKSA